MAQCSSDSCRNNSSAPARGTRRVPDFNYNRADTLASMDRIEKIIKVSKAVVQHDLGDFKAMPKFPEYLD